MTDNALAPHQFGNAAPGFPYNGIAGPGQPTAGGDPSHSGPGSRGGPTSMDYSHQQPNSPYFGGGGPGVQQPPNARTVPGSGGPVGYPKMGPGRPGGWNPMMPSQPRGFPPGSMPPQQGGPVPTPTLNQLLQGPGAVSDLRHPPGYGTPDYGQPGPPKMGPEDFGPGSMGFGGPPGWAPQQRMGPGGMHPSQMMGIQSMESARYEMNRRNMQQAGMVMRYPQLGPDMHNSPQYSPNSQSSAIQQQGVNATQIQPSPSTTPLSQHSDHASSAQSSPPQQPPNKIKKKAESRPQSAAQESCSSDEANADGSSASRPQAGSTSVTAGSSQSQPRPSSAYGLPPAPSPAGSVGSRSNTPASLSGTMIGSPSGSLHDVQNRIMSPLHNQVGHPQQMMPPPSMYPAPGGGGKLMMHQGGGNPNVMQSSANAYGAQPPFNNQGVPGVCNPPPGFGGHGMESFNGPNQSAPGPYRGMNYPVPYSNTSGMEQYGASGAGPGMTLQQPAGDHSASQQQQQQQQMHGSARSANAGMDDQNASSRLAPPVEADGIMASQSSTGDSSAKGSGQQPPGSDSGNARSGGHPGTDEVARRPPLPQPMDGTPGRPNHPPMGMDGNMWRPGQPGIDVNSSQMKAMLSRQAQFMGMNGMATRPQMPQFGPDGMHGRSGEMSMGENMPGRAGPPGENVTDGMTPRPEPPMGMDNAHGGNRPGPQMAPEMMQMRHAQQANMDGMFGRPGQPMPGDSNVGRPGQPLSMEAMLRRPMGGELHMNRPGQMPNVEGMPGRTNMQGVPGREEENLGGEEMQMRPGQPMGQMGFPARPPMDVTPSRPMPPMAGMENMPLRPMQHPMGMDVMSRTGQPMRMDGMDRRGPLPEGVGPIPQHPVYGRQFPGYMNPPPSGQSGPTPHGFGGPEMLSGTDTMPRNHMMPPQMYSDVKSQPMPTGPDVYRSGPEFAGDQRRFAANGDLDVMRRMSDQPGLPPIGGETGTEGGARFMKGEESRGEFMPNSGMMMKPSTNFDSDDIGRLKQSAMSKREKMEAMFHPPLSAGSRVAPSPATSTQEEIDSTSNLSWPSTPKSSHNDVLNRLADMGDEPDRRKLLERLFAFMDERGTPIVAVPTISKIPVDLYRLYHIVKEYGGMVEVTKNKKWRDVSSALSLGPSSSAGFTLKKNYGKHLFPFECRFDRGNIDPAPLLAFLEQPSKKESKKAAAERQQAAAAAAAGTAEGFRPPYGGTSGYPHGGAPPGVDPMMMQQPMSGPYGSGVAPNGGSMMHHGMPPPTQPGSEGTINVQNPFSEGQATPGNYGRQNYGQMGPSSSGFEGRAPAYGMRPQGYSHQGEPFDGAYGNTDANPGACMPYPGRQMGDAAASRFEPGPPVPGAYGYSGSQARMDKYGPAGPYGPGQSPMQRPSGRPYFGDQPDGYPSPYGMHRGSQPWMPPNTCPPNYNAQFSGPMLPPEPYRFPGSASPYVHPVGPCLSPQSRTEQSSLTMQRSSSLFAARRELLFPSDSVEATRPNLTKLKRITHRQLGPVDPWRLLMSLKSGLIAESTWSLDVLSILLRDESTVLWFGLQQLPGLVDVLLEHFRRCLIEIFPSDFDELEITLESVTMSRVIRKTGERDMDVKGTIVTGVDWLTTNGRSDGARKSYMVDGRSARAVSEGAALTDDKAWDVFGEIDSSLLDWQMGRGDTSIHVQTRFSHEGSVLFARDRFFGRHSQQLTDFTKSQQPGLNRFETVPVRSTPKHAPSVSPDVNVDDKLPVLASAVQEVKTELDADKELTDNAENQSLSKLEPPDIVRDLTDSKVDSKEAVKTAAEPLQHIIEAAFSDDRGLETLKRKWTEELEEDSEAYERDIQSIFVTSDAHTEMSRRCLSVSNVLRGLSFVPGNDSELARHPGLLAALGRLLLLGHRHPREVHRRLSRSPDDDDAGIADDDTPIRTAVHDRWRWDTIDVLREDTLVIFANISGQLDLATFPEEICIPILDGLLHWASCSAACALDPLPSTPNGCGPSPRRLALEALCKLCVTDSNVDLLLATPPFKRIVCLLDDLVNILSDAMSDQVAREFAVVLASSLAAADASAARAIALRRSSVSAFLGFIEAADRQAQQLVQAQGIAMLRDNPEMMGTSVDMLRRAASVVRAVAETSDSRSSLFADHQQRLLQLSMSPTLDSGVSSIIAEVLYLCSQAS